MSKRGKRASHDAAVVTWVDAHGITGAVDLDDERITNPYIRHSAGWLLRRSPAVVLAQTLDGQGVEYPLTIPRCLVKVLTVIEVYDEHD